MNHEENVTGTLSRPSSSSESPLGVHQSLNAPLKVRLTNLEKGAATASCRAFHWRLRWVAAGVEMRPIVETSVATLGSANMMPRTPEDYSRIPTSLNVGIGLMVGILFGVIVVKALLY